MLTQERLKQLLHYDPDAGAFTWLVKRGPRVNAGSPAGCVCRHLGYRQISVDGKTNYAHRLAFLYMTGQWPGGKVDHRDLDKTNNRWANIRVANNSQNGANASAPKNNASGRKGVSWCRTRKKWLAGIRVNYKRIALGCFDSLDQAAAAYAVAAKNHFGEFARTA